jgi:hypothetical protein
VVYYHLLQLVLGEFVRHANLGGCETLGLTEAYRRVSIAAYAAATSEVHTQTELLSMLQEFNIKSSHQGSFTLHLHLQTIHDTSNHNIQTLQNRFTQMTAVANMPGRWPKESRDNEGDITDGLNGPRLNTQMRELSLQVPTMNSTTSSQTSRDELFFDCPSPPQVASVDQNGESSSPSYLIFEPVVESVSEDEPTDWWRYEPPRELLDIQDGTSTDIRRLIEPSIERIRARRVEEEERQISAARHERPIARVGRASVKPLREVSNLCL